MSREENVNVNENNNGEKKVRRGYPVVGMKKIKVSELSDEFVALDPDVYIVAISEEENCRDALCVKAVMKKTNEIGTIHPMRVMKPITRSVKEVASFE